MTPSPLGPSPSTRERGDGSRGEGRLHAILQRLDAAYDYSAWHWQPDTPPDDICIGALLVQHTNWSNVERALERLRDAGALSLAAIARLPEARLAELVRSAGTPLVKARRLRALAQLAGGHGGIDALLALPTDELRATLLATPGIGPETADAILLYATGRPVFEIDAYTIRIFRRLGLGPESARYDAWQRWFQEGLPPDATGSPPRVGEGLGEGSATRLYRRYHGLLVLHGKQTCRPKPRCAQCCLLDVCETGRNAIS
jgi:endonuclease-3 related protein